MNIKELIITHPHYIQPHIAKSHAKKIAYITFTILAFVFLIKNFSWYVIDLGYYYFNLELIRPTLQIICMYLIWRGSILTTRSFSERNNFTRYAEVKQENAHLRTVSLLLGGLFIGISISLFIACVQSTHETIKEKPQLIIQPIQLLSKVI